MCGEKMEKQIIDAVFTREELWNPKNKNHKNVNVLQRKWKEIADEVGLEAKAVKNKWKYLRDYFQRECRKMAKLGGGEKLESPWQYFDMMLFVRDGFHSGNTVSNIRETDKPDDINDKGKTEYRVTNLPKLFPAPSVASTQSCTSSVIKKEKLVNVEEEMLKVKKRKLELLEKEREKEDDEDLHFFKSLLKDIKTLPPLQKCRLRLKMHQLVVEEVEKAERH